MTTKWVTVKKFAEETGYTAKAINNKIDKGQWPQGRMWRKAPDGRRHVNLEEYERWVESQPQT
ncbi:MAG: excisionase [Pseudomonadota bacterium]